MPISTFYNLPEDKKDKLLRSAIKEFTRVSYNEVSINQIVKDAGISRGSFYQYFKDKSDLLVFILQDFLVSLHECALTSLENSNGDIFTMFADLYDCLSVECLQDDHYQFFRNLFTSMRANNEELKQVPCDMNVPDFDPIFFKEHFNRDTLVYTEDEDILLLQSLLFNLTKSSVIKLILQPKDRERIRNDLNRTLMMIKTGCEKPR